MIGGFAVCAGWGGGSDGGEVEGMESRDDPFSGDWNHCRVASRYRMRAVDK